tara:strand:+ start:30946 stop:31110 length:165 start_codon:yes stop_codon:yes gene_type:complete
LKTGDRFRHWRGWCFRFAFAENEFNCRPSVRDDYFAAFDELDRLVDFIAFRDGF